jgi:hypothetical protein
MNLSKPAPSIYVLLLKSATINIPTVTVAQESQGIQGAPVKNIIKTGANVVLGIGIGKQSSILPEFNIIVGHGSPDPSAGQNQYLQSLTLRGGLSYLFTYPEVTSSGHQISTVGLSLLVSWERDQFTGPGTRSNIDQGFLINLTATFGYSRQLPWKK